MSLTENSKFTLSLGRLIFIIISVVGISFTIGMSYQSLLPDRQLQEKQNEEIQDIKVTMAKVVAVLENMEKQQADTKVDVSDLQTKAHVMNTEIQLMSSYIKENYDRKHNKK